MKSEYNDFISFLEKYRDELIVALSNEREKRQALISSDIERLEAVLQIQQAETMKLMSLESKRDAVQAALGFDNYKAKEIIAAVDDEEASKKLGKLFFEIVELVSKIRQQNKVAIEIANTNLRVIDKTMLHSNSVKHNVDYVLENDKVNNHSGKSSFEKTV